jgi:effector-binding domain-containing protein
LSSLRRLLAPVVAPIEVELRAMPATMTAAIRATVDHNEVLDWYGAAMADLDRTLESLRATPTGPCGGLYDNALFIDERGDVAVYVPVVDPPTSGRVRPFVVPAAELAITVHRGPHDDIDLSYGALGTYVTEHALAVAGPVHEINLVGPRDTDDGTAWRTEIGWPVFHTSAGRPSEHAWVRRLRTSFGVVLPRPTSTTLPITNWTVCHVRGAQGARTVAADSAASARPT